MVQRHFRWLLAVLLLAWTAGCVMNPQPLMVDSISGEPQKEISDDSLPKSKQTKLGLYVTASEAYARWLADPEGIFILDCRTPEEYVFVGHAPMAVNIPKKSMKYELNLN